MKGLAESVGMLGESFDYLWNDTGLNEIIKIFAEAAAVAGIRLLSGAIEILSGVLDVVSGIIINVYGLLTGDMDKAVKGANIFFKGLGKIIEGVFVIILGKEAVEKIKEFVKEWGTRISAWWKNDVTPWFSAKQWGQLWSDVKTWWVNGWGNVALWWNEVIVSWWNDKVAVWFAATQWGRYGVMFAIGLKTDGRRLWIGGTGLHW